MSHHQEGGPGHGPGENPGGHGHGCCTHPGGGARDHLAETAGMWESAFYAALRQVHVDILKEKIRKAWGKRIESVADEVVEAMMEEWKSSMKREEARDSLKAAVRKGFSGGPQ